MFVKYVMQNDNDYRGNVKLVVRNAQSEDVAYSQIEVKDNDMVELVQAEIDLVNNKVGEGWLEHRERLKIELDLLADKVRRSHLEVGKSIDIEYLQVEQVLKDWQAAGSPSNDVPDEIEVWREVNNETLQWAVNDIEQAIGLYRDVIRQVRRLRLEGKAAIDNASTSSIVSTYTNYYDQLNAMMGEPYW